jgi:4-hydroxybenzoate polyprenyltransferase
MSTDGVLARRRGLIPALVVGMRPHQWTKNLAVFAALVFAQKLGDPYAVLRASLAFLFFCGASSACYLFNDVVDAERDRSHPTKCRRPVASGELPAQAALLASAVLAGIAIAGGVGLRLRFGGIVAVYLVLQLGYSLLLKHVVILDVLCIAASFVLRADAGAVVLRVPFSSWLMFCAGLLALFLALAKRRHEIVQVEDAVNHRRSLADYTPQMLDQMISVVTASTLVTYCIYTVWPTTVEKFGTDGLKYTIPFVLYGVFRYLYLVYSKDGGGSPSRHLLTDKPLLLDIFLYAVVSAWIVSR